MSVKIYISTDDVWSFFQKNTHRLSEEMVVIAENVDTEYAVYLTEEDGFPLFVVCRGDNDAEYSERVINQVDCEEAAKRCYMRYLYPLTIEHDKALLNNDIQVDKNEISDLVGDNLSRAEQTETVLRQRSSQNEIKSPCSCEFSGCHP